MCGQIVITEVYLSCCTFPVLAQYPSGYHSLPSITFRDGGSFYMQRVGESRVIFEKVLQMIQMVL